MKFQTFRFTKYLVVLFHFYSTILIGQHETDNWYFSDGAALQFRNGTITTLNNSQIVFAEPASSISDCRGNLLFYTDGNKVWNSQHRLMVNGFGLNGHYSSTQGALIVPWPGKCNLFYIFTLDAIEHGFANGLNYSLVDIEQQNQEGEIISKNNLLYTFASEKMTAVHHSDGIRFWVISHEMRSNRFMVYQVNESGLDTMPVISQTGGVLSNPNMALGQMKASPDGSKVALVTLYPSEIHILDFDSSTGKLSNPKILDAVGLNGSALYGLEFSPDSKLLYVARHDIDYISKSGFLYQLDLSYSNSTEILNSALVVGMNTPLTDLRGLQLTNDGRIMVCKNLSDYYGIIRNPNVRGAACNYEDHALSTGIFLSYWTFPDFVASYFSNAYNSEVSSRIEINNPVCTGEILQVQNKSNHAVNYLWDFGNGDFSTEKNPNYKFADTGNFQIRLIASNDHCCADTSIVEIHVKTCNENLFVPNSFSPNGDQINDYFGIVGPTITGFSIVIYDRWGNQVFEDSQVQSYLKLDRIWDGKAHGYKCLPGVYIYKLEASFESGSKKIIAGNITLVN